MSKQEFIAYLQSVIDSKYEGLQTKFAHSHGLSLPYVNDILKSRRDPGKKILEAVGVERLVVYRLK